MQVSQLPDRELYQAGIAALQGGNLDKACGLLSELSQRSTADTSAWTALALTHHHLNNQTDALNAIENALVMEPGNITGHILKGDWLFKAGQETRANQAYATAISLAENGQDIPVELAPEISRIRAVCASINQRISEQMLDSLEQEGVTPDTYSRRFTHALELLHGKREIYFQKPRAFYYPELPQIQFYDPATFEWRSKIEQATEVICEELNAVLADKTGLQPYIHTEEQGIAARNHGLLDDPDWSAFFLIKEGKVVEENANRCPQTMKALEGVPFPRIDGRDPMVLFSVLRPGARIAPHHGFLNTRLICHLPLIVPDGCGFRVGNETRQWQKGELMVFDDSIEHEAWNNSNETRVVLIFDIWRPEFSEQERHEVSQLLKSIPGF